MLQANPGRKVCASFCNFQLVQIGPPKANNVSFSPTENGAKLENRKVECLLGRFGKARFGPFGCGSMATKATVKIPAVVYQRPSDVGSVRVVKCVCV